MSAQIPTAVYCRISTEKEDQLNSLENQRSFFLGYIEKHPHLSLYRIYADSGISGTAAKNRREFMRMMEDAKDGSFKVLITKEVSRFSRNILDAVQYTRELKKLGVRVIFMNDGIDTFQPDSELRLSIMAGFAQEESRKISDRVKWGQTRSMESGVVFGSSMLGYNVSDGKLSIEPYGAAVVKEIYQKYLTGGLSAEKIAAQLEKQGIKTFHSKEKWNPSVVMKILKNEKYCGDLKQKKSYTPDYLSHEKRKNHGEEDFIFIKGHHQAIIPPKTWEAVQEEIKRRTKNRSISKGRGTKYPLSGKIFCGVCGSAFVCRKRYSSSKITTVWKCSSAIKGKEVCSGGKQLKNLHCLYMASYCLELLFSSGTISKKRTAEKITKLITDAKNQNSIENEKRKTEAERELQMIKNKRLSVLELYISNSISLWDMEALRNKYDDDIAKLEESLKALTCSHNDKSISSADETLSKLETLLHSEKVICGCVEKIIFSPNGTAELKFICLPEIYKFFIGKTDKKHCLKNKKVPAETDTFLFDK